MPTASTATPPETASERRERHHAVLRELTEIGMDMARAVREQALAGGDTAATGNSGLAFSRIAKSVRLTVALDARIEEEAAAEIRRRENAAARRAMVERMLFRGGKPPVPEPAENPVETESEPDEPSGDLRAERRERLEHEDIDAELGNRPVGEIIAGIRKDLGLAPDPALLNDEDWGLPGPAPAARPNTLGVFPDRPRGPAPTGSPSATPSRGPPPA